MRVFFYSILSLILLALPGCNRLFGVRQEMRLVLSNEPRTLDWVEVESPEELFLLRQLQRTLITVDANKKEVPDLADGWSVDASQKRLVFSLGKHFWSDGVALTPDDFIHAWKRHLAPGSKSKALPTLLQIQGAAAFHQGKSADFAVRAGTNRTLEIELEKASSSFLPGLASILLGPQRRDVFLAFPQSHTTALHLRTIGPYQPYDWTPGKSMLLVSNSYFPAVLDAARIRVFFIPKNGADIQLDLAKGKIEVGSRVLWPQQPGSDLQLQAVHWR
jgi:ABC-type oligopeptide transport system substrate-binding subunit